MNYIRVRRMAMAIVSVVTIGMSTLPVNAVANTTVVYEEEVSADAQEEVLIAREEMTRLSIATSYTLEKKSTTTAHVSNLGYICYRPEASKENAKALIVYLHGADGRGSNLDKLLQIEGIPYYIKQGKIYPNAVVIAPQCPSGTSWTKLSKDVMQLIQTVIEEENIDTTRISLTGASLGGIGTFNIANENPTFFSAVVPVCGSVNAANCKVLTDVPVRIFHGTLDTGMGFSCKAAAQVIKDNGGTCELFMLEGEGHEIRHVYIDEEYNLIDWMINQQRNQEQ